LNENAQKVSASIVCFFVHLDPSRVAEIKKEFVFMKSIMRYGFFVRSNTEKYLSKKELMAEVVTMLE
jgi:ribosomal protein S6